MDYDTALSKLHAVRDGSYLRGMQWFGLKTENALGVSMPKIRKIAREIGIDQGLSLELWDSNLHEARMLAGLIGDPNEVTERQMEKWAGQMDSWGIVDGVCGGLFDKTPFAIKKINEWSRRDEEYVKRCAFTLMAGLAVHDKKLGNREFERFIPIIVRESTDERNFVKKAVNWALRQIGKRNMHLNAVAVKAAKELKSSNSKSARWIGSDAFRELTNVKTAERIARRIT